MDIKAHLNNAKEIKKLYKSIKNSGDDFDKHLDKIEKIHKQYIDEFRQYLETSKLSKKTINKHINHVDSYLNFFITYYFDNTIYDGMLDYVTFFSDFYIRKFMSSSVDDMSSFITSIDKFYFFMLQNKYVSKADYDESKLTIKHCKDEWLENMRLHDEYIISNAFEDMSFNEYCLSKMNDDIDA